MDHGQDKYEHETKEDIVDLNMDEMADTDIDDNIALEMVSVLNRKSNKFATDITTQEGDMITEAIINEESKSYEL